MNYHYYSPMHRKKGTNLSMLHATDIVKLENQRGAKGFLPPHNEDYHTWDQELYCPMAGTVVKVVNDIPDNTPFCGTYPYNAGNIVVIQKDVYYLLLGHLKEGSITVTEGQAVTENQIIARAGSSGFSERPHLHMQLMNSPTSNYWSGMGISIQYNGKNLFKNRRITV
jgi:murein DD-endopeptidase MepM/ murein hydrolase activator NlpD